MGLDNASMLLHQRRYADCREAVRALLKRGGLDDLQRARAFLLLSRCLGGLRSDQEAIGPGELAVHFSRHIRAYDLLGESLIHLSSVYHVNRLSKRSISCLDQYFFYFTLYTTAHRLEGTAFQQMARSYQSLNRHSRALEYFEKTFRWHQERSCDAAQLDEYRSEWAWQCLKSGRVELAEDLLAQSKQYVDQTPDDVPASARYGCTVAYRAYLQGLHHRAIRKASQTLHLPGISRAHKAQAFLVLHLSARALGLTEYAVATGVLAKMQASLARRSDLDEEVSRSLLQMQYKDRLPSLEDIFHGLRQFIST